MKRVVTLQRWSSQWDCYVDTTVDNIVNGNKITIRDSVINKMPQTSNYTEVRI